MKLWQKKIQSLKEVEKFTVGNDREFDMQLAPFDVLGSIAHVTMLETVGLLEKAEKEKLITELQAIYHHIQQPGSEFGIDESVEDIHSQVETRSLRMRSSTIPAEHPLVKAGLSLGKKTYGSPTTSDKALMPFPALKAGPGDSARSHTADEFIYLQEINDGVEFYIDLLKKLL